jgi:hypothetical protein
MIFDKLCGVVERQLPELRKYVDGARLFHFEGNPHEFIPERFEEIEFLRENFYLPFRTVALEDNASVIIIQDPEPNMRGLQPMRFYLECLPFSKERNEAAFDDERLGIIALDTKKEIRRWASTLADERLTISWGFIRIEFVERLGADMITRVEGSVLETMLVSKTEIFHRLNHDEIRQSPGSDIIKQGVLVNAKVALQEVVIMNQPKNFVLEIAPAKTKHTAKSGKIVRSGDRPIYMVLSPMEIRMRMSLPDPRTQTGRTVAPHERRAHTRTYRNARFVNVQGKQVVIPATWVGRSEAIIGKKIYKVRLDI